MIMIISDPKTGKSLRIESESVTHETVSHSFSPSWPYTMTETHIDEDADHAAALEREAIAAWLERICDDILHHAQKADDAGEVEASRAAFIDLSIRRAEVQEIRNGDHWRVER